MERPPADPPKPIIIVREKPTYWRKIGGGSLAVSLVGHGILLTGGLVWILKVTPPPPERVVEFRSSDSGGGQRSARSPKPTVVPSQSVASRIAAQGAMSNFTLPEPAASGGMASLGALGGGGGLGGIGGGRGSGVGAGLGSGLGGGAGMAFFGMELRARRIAYVIDFSLSMSVEGRDALMRQELTRSVKNLPQRIQYQLIFFSGPVWIAGDEVESDRVTHRGETYHWLSRSAFDWRPKGPLMRAEWLESTPAEIERSLKLIQDTPLVSGTDWESPLEMAMSMEPPPEAIYFMTDGAMDGRDMNRLVRRLADKAWMRKIRVNVVNMMVPDDAAVAALSELATRTGGAFTIVEEGGKVRHVDKTTK